MRESKERQCGWKCEGSMLCLWSFFGGNIPSFPVAPTCAVIEHMIVVFEGSDPGHSLLIQMSGCVPEFNEKCWRRPKECERMQVFEDIYGIINLN